MSYVMLGVSIHISLMLLEAPLKCVDGFDLNQHLKRLLEGFKILLLLKYIFIDVYVSEVKYKEVRGATLHCTLWRAHSKHKIFHDYGIQD